MNPYEIEHLDLLRPGLAECTVLLKKDGGFPLFAPGKIAAYGSGVRHTVKGGTGSGEVNSRYFVTVEQGLKNAGFTVTTEGWLDAYDGIREKANEQFIKDIKGRARRNHTLAILEGMGAVMPEPEYDLPLEGEGDTAIYVLSRISGEGNDRNVTPGDYLLSETEKRDILALNAKYEKFMLVLNVGGPVDLTPVLEVKNILVLSQLGVETGTALAQILLGRAVPSGKLATTWAPMENYPDVGNFGDLNDTYYKEGIYVGYRWFDAARKAVTFPFGFGLGYTEFDISGETVTVTGKNVILAADVKNVGLYPGKETVQVYISCPQGKLDKPVKDLAAFVKTRLLAPGETQRVAVSFDVTDHASFDEKTSAWILEQGRYIVRCGNSSVAPKAVAALELRETVVTRQAENLLGYPGFQDWKSDPHSDSLNVPVTVLDPAYLTGGPAGYEEPPVDSTVMGLSDSDLCYMGIGAFDPKGGIANVIGSASTHVAGAAGESCSLFKNRGIPGMVFADGPAGLRISAQYYQDRKGLHAFGPSIPATMLPFMPKLVQPLLGGAPKLPQGAELKEQYCTAIPIGTAIAQSWNMEFANTCGDVVGRELERFGVHLWLAPALNIHRSPMCGRNFEYYSEDPVISGLVSAAITKGVQSHPGRGVTLKHYAANNQETNRYASNSRVSQRAMREIYLKGFGIAIRESAPKAVMTSYNLLNGIHTSESKDLCMGILRREFGFRGVCMTDWVVSMMPAAKGAIYGTPDPAKVAAAGGDLFMPGGASDYKKLARGLKSGLVTRQTLLENATRVCLLARELTE